MKKFIFVACLFIVFNLWATIPNFDEKKFKEFNDIQAFMGIDANNDSQKTVKLSQPNHPDEFILDFAHTAIIASYTYDFVNFEDEFRSAALFYTPKAWRNVRNHLENNLPPVIMKKLIVTSVATKLPILLRKGIANGHYFWEVETPILITYQSASQYAQKLETIKLTISRVDSKVNPLGIAIIQ